MTPVLPPHRLRRALPRDAEISYWSAPDGWRVRCLGWPANPVRGTIVFAGGRGDIFEKYLETFDHWHRAGWTIRAFDWRGHGGSGRLTNSATVGHLDTFAALVSDLAELLRSFDDLPRPLVVIGHSMGGHAVLRALAEGAIQPDAAILHSPMLKIRTPLGAWLSERLARYQCRRGDPGRPAWRPQGSASARMDADAMLTGDYARLLDEHWWHEQMPGVRLGPPSWGWLAEAFASSRELRDGRDALRRISTPILVLAADNDRLTDSRATAAVVRLMPNATLVRFGGDAGHELIREVDPVRGRAIEVIDDFLERRVAAAAGREAG